jgi:hypothetical protein
MKKVNLAIFLVFTHRFENKKQKKFGSKNAEKFSQSFDIFQFFTISKMKTRTQIFPSIDTSKKLF